MSSYLPSILAVGAYWLGLALGYRWCKREAENQVAMHNAEFHSTDRGASS